MEDTGLIATLPRIALVTDNSDAHAARFSESLKLRFDSFEWVLIERLPEKPVSTVIDDKAITGWHQIITALKEKFGLVISGPLDSVTSRLSNLDIPHIGISWATDIMVSARSSEKILHEIENSLPKLRYVITDNVATENALIALGAEPDQVVRFPWGPSTHLTRPNSATNMLVSKDPLPGFASCLFGRAVEPHYRPLIFVEAIHQLKLRGLCVAGYLLERGSSVTAVKEHVAKLGIESSIYWLPALAPEDFNDSLRHFDLLVSIPITDGTSVTVLEAMRAGTPVITAFSSGTAEWIIDGITGWNLEETTAAGLASGIEHFLARPKTTLDKVRRNAQRLVEQKAGWANGVEKIWLKIEEILPPR